MYNHLSRSQLIKELKDTKSELDNMISLYENTAKNQQETSGLMLNYVYQILGFEEEIKRLKDCILNPFNVKDEFKKIKQELREIDEWEPPHDIKEFDND